MTVIEGWENFYVIVGSSAGALIGLQFVVITLIAERPIPRSAAQTGGAFATPSVVHFGVVLLLSAIVSAPWDEITIVAVLWGLLGVGGIVYIVIVSRRMRNQTAYRPVFEDWLFHAVLPFAAYATLSASACAARAHPTECLFGVATAALLLLFVLATKETTAANAIFLQYTAPVYLLIFEPLFYKENFRSRDLIVVIACVVGMSLFFVGMMLVGGMLGMIHIPLPFVDPAILEGGD